ncbi:MAG: ABC-2 family transporter protein [Bacillota bacterium]|jgi:ABC-2 type transport system permease protein|nr:hypothetical protein [Bacillota bacterium]
MSTAGRTGAVTSQVRFVWEHFKFNLAAAMEYKAGFVSQVVFMLLNDMFLLFFWWIVFRRVSSIGGWTFQHVIAMHATLATSFGISVAVFGNSQGLPRIIAEGQLDYYLLLPRDPLLHVLVSRSDISGLGDVAFGIVAMALLGRERLSSLPVLCITALAGAAIFTSFNVIAGTLAFFVGHAQTISDQVGNALITFSTYPEPVFKGAVRVLLYTLLPAGFMVYLPVRLVSAFDPFVLAAILSFAAASIAAAGWAFRRGLKRYESGSLVVVRM